MNTLNNDLAALHKPISNLFKQPDSAEAWKQYALSEAQIAFYKENGFVSGIKVLEAHQIEQLKEELEGLVKNLPEEKKALFYHYNSNESEDQSKVLFHALGAWRVAPAFHDILWAPAFRMAAYQLLGSSYRHFHDQLFCKPAKHGGVVAWHQDFSYWTWTKPNNHLTCWVGLDDASEDNGCLYFVPGSHKWGLLPITGLTGDMDAVRKVLTPEQNKAMDNKFANVLKKGYASFHHPICMHGSYANGSNRQRRAVVLNVMADGTRSNVDALKRPEDLQGFPIIPQDEKMEGTFYPVLFDKDMELIKTIIDEIPTINDFD